MTRKRASPMGLEIYLPILLAFIMLPLLAQAAPLQDYTEIQQYTEGCYYNYNHYNEGDRIMTNEPCLNCTCHNKMLMCYLRVCPFTKPIGNDCIVEKREDQCCPIITCPEVPVDVPHPAPESGTDLSFPEKFGCSIEGKFYLEGAQVPSNPNKPCELCYCIKNRTSCLMQECTLHIDGCTPIYNKGSCCPVRYNCDHENDVLELEDHSTTTEAATTTTTVRPTTGFILNSTMTPAVSTICVHNNEVYADGARIDGETACENCYCMRGDIVCAVQECHMPMLKDNGKLCHPLPAAEGECCPSNYACEDDSETTQPIEYTTLPYSISDEEVKISTGVPVKDLHSAIPEEDLQLQTHIDEEETATKTPATEAATDTKDPKTTEDRDKIDVNQETTENLDREDSTTKYDDHNERTTISPSDVKVIESGEFTTAASTSSDKLSESTTETIENVSDEVKTETNEKVADEHSSEKEEESITKIPTDTDELPDVPSEPADSGEEYTTVTYASDKPEIEEVVTKVSAIDDESSSTTLIVPNEKEISEETTKTVAGGDYTTHVPSVSEEFDFTESSHKENKPIEQEEPVTETYKSITESTITTEIEYEPVDSPTKSPLDVKTTGPTAEEVHAETIFPLTVEQQNDLTTKGPEESSQDDKEKSDDLSTKSPTVNESVESISTKPEEVSSIEENVGSTTQAPEDDDLSTEEPKEEEKPEDNKKEEQEAVTTATISSDIDEQGTESEDKSELSGSTETSNESDDSELFTKLPVSAAEKEISFTPTSPGDEESDNVSTTSAYTEIEDPSELFAKEKPVSDDKKYIDNTSGIPEKPDDHSAVPSMEIKPMVVDELGSGDYTTETSPEIPSEISTDGPAIEAITSISQKQEEESVTAKTFPQTEEKLEQQNGSSESSEESSESEEEKKLIDLTTENPSVLDATAKPSGLEATADNSEKVAEEEKETTTKSSSEQSVMTPDENKAQGQNANVDKIDSTTVVTSVDKKLQTEILSTTSSTDALNKSDSSTETSKEVETTEKSTKLEDNTSQRTIEKHEKQTSATPTRGIITEEEQDEQKVLPESDDHKVEEQSLTTDSPMLIIEDISAIITAKPTTQSDIRTENNDNPEEGQKVESTIRQEPSPDVKEGFEKESPTTTTKPFVEPSRPQEVQDMELPSVIPGEGDCLAGQKTYNNNTIVPTSDECEVACRCISSVIVCERVKCDVPENIEKCILNEAGTNKCCPTYVCSTGPLPPKSEDNTESIEEVQYATTTSSKISTGEISEENDIIESKITTMKPIYDAVSIPEIEMPVAMTEEPMSHVKDEDELEHQTTKYPIKTIAEEKKDVFIEDHLPMIPDIAEEVVVPQSMAPVEISKHEEQEIVTENILVKKPQMEAVPEVSVSQEREQEIATEKILLKSPEKEAVPVKSVSEEQPENEFVEQTTSVHLFEISATDETVKVGSDNQGNEIYTTTIAPTAFVPLKEEEDEEKKTELEPQTSTSTSLEEETPHKNSEEPETGLYDSSTETVKESEVQTDKMFSYETTEKPHIVLSTESNVNKEEVQEPESQTIQSIARDEFGTLTPFIDEIKPEITTSDEFEEKQPSTGDYRKDISDSTTSIAPSKNYDAETGIVRTTELPSKDDFENDYSTTKLPSDEIKRHDIPSDALDKKLESISTTIASVTDQPHEDSSTVKDSDNVWSEEDKHVTKSTEKGIFEKEIESTTEVYRSDDKVSVDHVIIMEDETTEHTVPSIVLDEHKETTDESFAPEISISGSTKPNQEETQTNIAFIDDHTILQATEEFDENNNEKESDTTSVPIFDKKISVDTDSADIATEKSIEQETKTTTYPSSVLYTESLSHNIIEGVPTTVASDIENNDESKESDEGQAVDSSTDNSLGLETHSSEEIESEEITKTTGTPTEKATESTKEENITIPTVEHVKEHPDVSMVHTVGPSDILKTQKTIDDSTIGPIISNEYTTEAIFSVEDAATVKEDETIFDKYNEPTSVSKIPNAHAPVRTPSLDLFEESSGESVESEEEISTTPNAISHISEFVTERVEEQEKEGSGQEVEEQEREGSGEEVEGTDKMETVTEEHSEMSDTTELTKISDKHELNDVTTDKISTIDIESVTKAPISSENTEKDIIPSVTEALSVEQNIALQTEDDIVPSVDKEIFDVSTEQPKEELDIVTTQIPEIKDKEYVTKPTMSATQQYGNKDTTIPTASEDVTFKSPILDEKIEAVTIVPNGSDHEINEFDERDPITEQPDTVTDKQEDDEEKISAVTRSPIPSANIDYATEEISEESEEPLDSETTTTKIPTNEISDLTTEKIAMTTPEPSKDSQEEVSDVTKVPESLESEAKFPGHGEGLDKHDVSDYVTELPAGGIQYEEETEEDVTEIPSIDDSITVKLPDIVEQATELPVKGTEAEIYEQHDVSANVPAAEEVSTEKLSEHVTELPTEGIKSDEEYLVEITEPSIGPHESTEHLTENETDKEVTQKITTDLPMDSDESVDKLPEQNTALPSKHIESDDVTTELPVFAEGSTAKPYEQDSQLPTKVAHAEDEQSYEQTTRLPVDVHVYTDNLTEKSQKEPHEKSTELPADPNVITEKSLEHVTELPTQYYEDDDETHMLTDEKEHIPETPEDAHISSEKLPEHITDIPTKYEEPEGETHALADKLPEHITESPYKDIESEEDVYEESTDKQSELPSKQAESKGESHEKSTQLPVEDHQVSTSGQAVEQTTEYVSYREETSKRTSTEVTEDLHSSTTVHPLFSHHTTLPSVITDSRIDDTSSQHTPVPANNEETFTNPTTTTVSTTTSETVTTTGPHYQPQPPVYGQPPQYGPTQYEDEYTDEDEGEVFGPGTCRYGGKLYVSAQQIPRDDPCDFCFCFRSDIICLQQSCPPPIAGCHEEPISGFCCPRYECPVSMATVLNITTSTTTTSTTLPPHFLHHSYGNNAQRNGCLINGRSYRVGEKIESTSGPCINCTCGGDGKMKCDPQACVPEPTMQQVMAAVAAGRKR